MRTYYVYDAAGSLTLKTDDPNDGGDRQLMADPNNYDPNGVYFAESFTYDGLGRQLTAQKVVDSNAISASVFAYYDKGELHTEAQTLFGGTQRTVTYGYDQVGFRTQTAYPDGSTTITRTNTFDGRINTLSRGQTQLAAFQYLGSRTARRAYNTSPAVNTDYAWDHLGRMTDITAGSLADFHYDYAADENNIWKIRFDHRSGTPYNEYGYDDIDRVTGVTYLDSDTENFVMDDLGNRFGNQTLRDDGTVNFAVDTETNRYTSVAGNTLAYDNAGNLTQDKDGYKFTYDYENRITEIRNDANSLIAKMDYDTQGRRIRKVDSIANTTTLYYYSDNWQVLAEYNGSGTLQAYYAYGNYIDEVLVMCRNNADFFCLHDHLFSPVALTDSSGTVQERYEYDAYGTIRFLSPNYELRTTSSFGNSVAFTGRESDTLDSGNLKKMHYRNREYSLFMGRFYQADPLGIRPDGTGQNLFEVIEQIEFRYNLYHYVDNNPISGQDSFGLKNDRSDSNGSIYDGKVGWSYMYLAAFHEPECRLSLSLLVRIRADKQIKERVSNLASSWENAVDSEFDHWKLVTNSTKCCACPKGINLDFRAVFVVGFPARSENQFIEVKQGVAGDRSDMTTWYLSDDRFSKAPYKGVVHEVAHMFGIKDEYYDSVYYPNKTPPADCQNSIMCSTSSSSRILKRHIEEAIQNVNVKLPCPPYKVQ